MKWLFFFLFLPVLHLWFSSLTSMTKQFIAATCYLLFVAIDAGVIFSHHPIIPNYHVHSGIHHEWIRLHSVASPATLNSIHLPAFVLDDDVVIGDVSSLANPTVEARRRDDTDSNYGEATIPNYRMFHFVLKLVKSMRKHFLPVYATDPEDISNIYVQYGNDKRR